MDAVTHLIAALRDRPDRVASVLWAWLERHDYAIGELATCLGCDTAALERLALVPLPKPGADWDDDVEIIEISLRLKPGALRELIQPLRAPRVRELGA